jgi:hypothetical protein
MILIRKWLPVVAVGALSALLMWLGLAVAAHLAQDHADHHLVLELLKYNIQQGHLAQLPVSAPPAPPVTPPRPPLDPKKP